MTYRLNLWSIDITRVFFFSPVNDSKIMGPENILLDSSLFAINMLKMDF
jgi:hypothetical protein